MPAAAGRSRSRATRSWEPGSATSSCCRVEGGRGAYAYRPALAPGEQATGVIPTMDRARPLAEFTEAIADDLAAKLAESGLYAKEARAMVNTWKTSYFQTDGIRVLFVLPQSWTDSFIPIRILPRPRELVRVMVGRLELLSRGARAADRGGGPRPGLRRRGAAVGRRSRISASRGGTSSRCCAALAATTRDEGVRTLCRRLLLTGFVTDLRAAIHNAADGKRLEAGPLELRAHLARLYREMGMTEEAKAEANAVWQGLRERTKGPNALAEDNPFVLTCRAAIHEARGEDRRAAEIYAGLIEQYVQVAAARRPSQHVRDASRAVGRPSVCRMPDPGRPGGFHDRQLAAEAGSTPGGAGRSRRAEDQRGLLLAFLLEARGQHGRGRRPVVAAGDQPGLALGHEDAEAREWHPPDRGQARVGGQSPRRPRCTDARRLRL